MLRDPETGRAVGWATREREDDGGREPFVVGSGEKLRETDKAILVDLRGKPDEFGGTSSHEMWVPKSVLHDDSEIYGSEIDSGGKDGKLVVFSWWAAKQGLRKA